MAEAAEAAEAAEEVAAATDSEPILVYSGKIYPSGAYLAGILLLILEGNNTEIHNINTICNKMLYNFLTI